MFLKGKFKSFCPCQRKVRKALILQGFRAFFIPKINFAKIAIYRKISYIFEHYMSPDMSPIKDREPFCDKGFLSFLLIENIAFFRVFFTACRNFDVFDTCFMYIYNAKNRAEWQ